jgi:hypothetical protein
LVLRPQKLVLLQHTHNGPLGKSTHGLYLLYDYFGTQRQRLAILTKRICRVLLVYGISNGVAIRRAFDGRACPPVWRSR